MCDRVCVTLQMHLVWAQSCAIVVVVCPVEESCGSSEQSCNTLPEDSRGGSTQLLQEDIGRGSALGRRFQQLWALLRSSKMNANTLWCRTQSAALKDVWRECLWMGEALPTRAFRPSCIERFDGALLVKTPRPRQSISFTAGRSRLMWHLSLPFTMP